MVYQTFRNPFCFGTTSCRSSGYGATAQRFLHHCVCLSLVTIVLMGTCTSSRRTLFTISHQGKQYGAFLAAIGNEPQHSIPGDLSRSDPANACSELVPQFSNRIVLVRQGQCDFAAKLRHAQKALAAAVIVIAEHDDWFVMGATNSTGIP